MVVDAHLPEAQPDSSAAITEATADIPCTLSVIIVNWNGGHLLERCLASLDRELRALRACSEVIVVDNDSSDASMQMVASRPSTVAIHNDRNLGFGRACNIGTRASRGHYLLFLNPDCEVRGGSIERCLAELQSATVGACGVALIDESGTVSRSCHRFPTLANFCVRIFGLQFISTRLSGGPMAEWDHGSDADVDHVIGAFYAIKRELFDRLGGFDERYFMYLEDLDLSLRIRHAGFRVRFLCAPASFHVGGGLSQQIKAKRLFYATRSRILYAYVHFPLWQARLHLALTVFIEPLTRSVLALARGSFGAFKETCVGFAMLWRDLPMTLRLAGRK